MYPHREMQTANEEYRYIEIGGKFYCQQQSLVKLSRLLLLRRKSCPDFMDWKLLLRLFLNRMKIRQYPEALGLKVFGSWCLRARCGYIVIDPYSGMATKIFDDDIDDDLVRKEIKQNRCVGQYDFAPSIKSWNAEERWYQEDYLSGKTSYYFSPEFSREFMRIYYEDVAPCLVGLMNFGDQNRTTIKGRIEAMDMEIRKEFSVLNEGSPEAVDSVRKFYDNVTRELYAHGDEDIYLVFTHGDFHLFNMFKTESGLKLIDWEGIGEQSLMYDFYNYFFSHLWVGRGRGTLVNEVADAEHEMAGRLEGINAELALSLLGKSNLYRMLYYLERIHALVTIFKLKSKPILTWINVYRTFEADRLLERRKRNRDLQ